MKLKNIFGNMSLILLVLILLSTTVSAHGLAPAKIPLNFEPNLEKEISFLALTKGDFPTYFTLELEGEFSKYAELDKNSLFINMGETQKEFKVKLKLPENLPPGPNILYVKVIEQDTLSTSTASAKNALVGQIIINVPYTGVYVDSKLEIEHGEIAKPMTFTVSLFGRGDIPAMCYATIDIFDPEGKKLDTIVTNQNQVAQAQATKVEAIWRNNLEKGLFDAQATVICAEQKTILKEQFYVGNPSVNVLEIKADNFILGEIAPIRLMLQNNWNRKFDDVFVEILVLDDFGKLIQQFKSATLPIGAEEIKEYTAYWETEKLSIGKYNLNVITYFDKKGTLQESFIADVGINKLTVQKATGQVIGAEEGKSSSFMPVIILLLVILVAMNAGFIYYLKSRKKIIK